MKLVMYFLTEVRSRFNGYPALSLLLVKEVIFHHTFTYLANQPTLAPG
jgi:hypothetical protein